MAWDPLHLTAAALTTGKEMRQAVGNNLEDKVRSLRSHFAVVCFGFAVVYDEYAICLEIYRETPCDNLQLVQRCSDAPMMGTAQHYCCCAHRVKLFFLHHESGLFTWVKSSDASHSLVAKFWS